MCLNGRMVIAVPAVHNGFSAGYIPSSFLLSRAVIVSPRHLRRFNAVYRPNEGWRMGYTLLERLERSHSVVDV